MDFLTGGILCVVLLLVAMAAGMQIGLAFLLGGFLVSAFAVGIQQLADPARAGGLFLDRGADLGGHSAVHPDGQLRVQRRVGAPRL